MHRIMHLLLALCIVVSLSGHAASSAAQLDAVLDLADVPLPVQSLPESGYQVVSGSYLSTEEIASLIAPPRNLDQESAVQQTENAGINRAYVLDLVLPEDRGWQDSPFLAVVQTAVYVVDEGSSTDSVIELLENFGNTDFVDPRDPAVDGATTIAMVGESGDQLRTIVTDGQVVIEIVSMDATGAPDETEHVLIVQGTLDRLSLIREGGASGLSSQAISLLPGANTGDFAHTQQTGIHGLYRFRDAAIQPAIGELNTEDQIPAQGMRSLWVGSQLSASGTGTDLVSVWLADFQTEGAASGFFDALISTSPGTEIFDPYFELDVEESWTEQGVLGVYRVTGTYQGQAYSGIVEIRQQGEVVIAVGYRAIGAALPSADITSTMMDYQLDCLESQQTCAPFDLVAALPPPAATPVVDASAAPGSSQFGWSVPNLGPEWSVTEQFSEQGYDRVGIQNGSSLFELESVVNHHGEPVQCVLDELHLLQEFEEHSDIRLWEDADGNTSGGNTANQAWVTYRVEPLADERADQEYVIRIDCFSLVPDSANLVVKHTAPVDLWVEEAPKGDVLRDAIQLPASQMGHGTLVVTAHERRTAMIYFHSTHHAA